MATESMAVVGCTEIKDAYELFMEYVAQGKMKIGRFEDKTEQQLQWWYSDLVEYLKEKEMVNNPECSYAVFMKKKFPQVWEKYMDTVQK